MQENTRDISAIKQRILQFAELEGISKYELYQKTGISNGVFSQKGGISEDNLLKFLSYYQNTNERWLLTGKGSMLKIQAKEEVPESMLNYEAGTPLLTTEAMAGFGNDVFSFSKQDIQAYYQVPDFNDIDFMIRVKGNSMYPKYSSGDVVACKILRERNFIQWNKPHLIATREQGIIIKRLRRGEKEGFFKAVSDNKDYEPFDIPENDITGIAIIIGIIRLE